MEKNINRKKKKHYLNRAPGSVLPGHCQKFTDDFHLFVCQRCPAEVAGSGGGGKLRVARHYFKRSGSESKKKNRQTAGEFGSEEVQEHQPWLLSRS